MDVSNMSIVYKNGTLWKYAHTAQAKTLLLYFGGDIQVIIHAYHCSHHKNMSETTN